MFSRNLLHCGYASSGHRQRPHKHLKAVVLPAIRFLSAFQNIFAYIGLRIGGRDVLRDERARLRLAFHRIER
jgi:hypothetical protein